VVAAREEGGMRTMNSLWDLAASSEVPQKSDFSAENIKRGRRWPAGLVLWGRGGGLQSGRQGGDPTPPLSPKRSIL